MNMKHRWVLSLVTGSFLSVTETFLLLFQGPSLEATCCYLQRTADSYRKHQPFFNCKGVSSNTLQYLFFAVWQCSVEIYLGRPRSLQTTLKMNHSAIFQPTTCLFSGWSIYSVFLFLVLSVAQTLADDHTRPSLEPVTKKPWCSFSLICGRVLLSQNYLLPCNYVCFICCLKLHHLVFNYSERHLSQSTGTELCL